MKEHLSYQLIVTCSPILLQQYGVHFYLKLIYYIMKKEGSGSPYLVGHSSYTNKWFVYISRKFEYIIGHTLRMPFRTQLVGNQRLELSLQLDSKQFTILICCLPYSTRLYFALYKIQMRIVNCFESSCKDVSNLWFPTNCVLKGILSVCPIIY